MNPRREALQALPSEALRAAAGDAPVTALSFTLVERLREAADAERVALGIRAYTSSPIRLLAVSGEADPDPRRAAVRRPLERLAEASALAEVADHGRATLIAIPGGAGATAHAEQAAEESLSLATVAVRQPDGSVLAWTLERAGDVPIGAAELDRYARASDASLALLARFDRLAEPRHRRARRAVRALYAGWRLGIGRSRLSTLWAAHVPRAATLALAVGLPLALAAVVPVPFDLVADVTLEPEDRQVVVATEPGHILSAHRRAGDRVDAGELLATLDDREARLAADRWRGEAHRNQEERSRALALRDRDALGGLQADAGRIAAELDVADRRVARARIEAPFDGVVLKGDPGLSLGAAVEAGDVLFELGSLDRYRVMLDVDERDVRHLASGQTARVRLAGLPGRDWQVRIDELAPVAISEPGSTVFRVPATLDDEVEALRPGMQGVARIRVGHRPLLDVWTRRLRERVMLLAWRIGWIR